MDQKNLVTLLISFMAFLKVVLNLKGIAIPDEISNAIVNGICAAVGAWGIWVSHEKQAPVPMMPIPTGSVVTVPVEDNTPVVVPGQTS